MLLIEQPFQQTRKTHKLSARTAATSRELHARCSNCCALKPQPTYAESKPWHQQEFFFEHKNWNLSTKRSKHRNLPIWKFVLPLGVFIFTYGFHYQTLTWCKSIPNQHNIYILYQITAKKPIPTNEKTKQQWMAHQWTDLPKLCGILLGSIHRIYNGHKS